MKSKLFIFFAFFIFIFPGWASAQTKDPLALYLTWQGDPTTTMTIQWISFSDDKETVVKYRANTKESDEPWRTVKGTSASLVKESPYLLHRTELKNLEPETEYVFRAGPQGLIYKFKTLPKTLEHPLRIAVGGDVFHDAIESLKETNREAAKTNPAFVLLGGDLAYSGLDVDSWIIWLCIWKQTMTTTDGFLIPMVVAIGNHDTESHYGAKPESAPIFYALFRPRGRTAYYTFDAGDYLALTILDTGHTAPIEGRQTDWLRRKLRKRQEYTYKFALYHVPAYPSARKFGTKKSAAVRKNWVPLFEKFGVQTAFENHDHCYKRTVSLKKGKEDPEGIVYIGDGAWGVTEPRENKRGLDGWYLAKAVSVRHFVLVTLEKSERRFEAIDSKGNRFDRHSVLMPSKDQEEKKKDAA